MKRLLISIIAAVGIMLLVGRAKASTTFQGVTFTFTQIDADTLRFEIVRYADVVTGARRSTLLRSTSRMSASTSAQIRARPTDRVPPASWD